MRSCFRRQASRPARVAAAALMASLDPPAAAAWADRSRSSPAMIAHGDAAWRAFSAIGWTWGGDWHSLKDCQHFSANGL